MKTCPKCGTILDDSKKKCYMCGADLTKTVFNKVNLNVQNNTNKPSNSKTEVVVNKEAEEAALNVNLYNSELNRMNSTSTEEKKKFEKIFSEQSEAKSKEQQKLEKKSKKDNKIDKKTKPVKKDKKNKKTENVQIDTPVPQAPKNINNNVFPSQMPNNTNIKTSVIQVPNNTFSNAKTNISNNVNKVNNGINWGNNLSSKANKADGNKKINSRLIFNIVCAVLFVGCIITAIVIFINKKNDSESNKTTFGGLSYKIDDSFTLKSKETNRRHYTMGSNCSISISYGPTSDKDGFVDSYFENIKKSYEKQEGFTTQTTELTIKGNVWSEMSIIELRKTGESDISYSTYTRYKYTSIVNDGNFYVLMFANTDDNAECSAKYDKLIDSLKFE